MNQDNEQSTWEEGYDDTAPCPECGMPGPGDYAWWEDDE